MSGILKRAIDAKEKIDISNEKEAIQLAVISFLIESGDILSVDEVSLTDKLSNISISVVKNDYYFDITGNTGTKYKIIEDGRVYTEEELKDVIVQEALNKGYLTITAPIPTVNDSGQGRVTYTSARNFPDSFEIINTGILFAREENNFNISAQEFVVESNVEGLGYAAGQSRNGTKTLNVIDYRKWC